ncbi:hypothetical protein [Pedobacter heparinus]|uniref:hypothetical protein n=1 Tax=Pedobacter heparinus TaxID=984 RepID=UPI00293045DB|nr:hypothetical protein [Pedobacter heparinus]
MKKNLLLSLTLILLMAATSCNKIKEATERDINITPDAVEFTMPKIISTTELKVVDVAAPIDIDAMIKAKADQFGVKNLRNVRITSLKLDIISGMDDANNFANIESLSAKIEATGQAALTIASVANNPDVKAGTLVIPVTAGSTELKSYLTAGNFKYTLSFKARRVTDKELRIRATATYQLTVGL